MGCTKSTVSKIFCLSSTEDLQAMKTIWEQKNDSPLSDRLRSELSGEHEGLILYLLQHGRGQGVRDEAFSQQKAAELQSAIKAGKGMMGGLSSKAQKQVKGCMCV